MFGGRNLGIDKEKILDVAQKYILKGQSKKAIKEYLKLMEANPNDKRLHLKLGDLYLKNNEEDKAIQEYLKVANLYAEEDLNFRAISIYKKILSINSKSIEALLNIAKLYLKEGLGGSAKSYYQSLLEIDPHQVEALNALKKLENMQPSGEGAFPSSAMAKTPSYPQERSRPNSSPHATHTSPAIGPEHAGFDKDAEMHYHLGIAYKEMELFDYAISEFEVAASSPGMMFDSYIMLGNCYMEKGDYNKSIEYYKMASEIQGLPEEKTARLYYNLGSAYEANGMISEAIDTFHQALKLDPSFTEAQEKIKKLQH